MIPRLILCPFACLSLSVVTGLPSPSAAHNGENTAFAIPLQEIAIGGRLHDWPADIEVYPVEWVSPFFYRETPPDGPEDFTESFRVAYDRETSFLYVAVVVRDDELVFHPGEDIARTDAGGVVERVYEMGELAVESDLTWEIVVPLHSTTVVSGGAVPSRFVLEQNHPNPFNSATTIRYDLPLSVEIELALYNLAGQKVATLGHGSRMAGTHTLHWDGRDDNGRELASAVYLYRLAAGEHVETKKLLLLR